MSHNKYAPSIEDIIAVSGIDTMAPGRNDITKRMAELSMMQEGQDVLVVSSHRGHQANLYAGDYGVKVIGLDIDPAMVETSIENSKLCDVNQFVRYVIGDSQDLPFEDNRFDVVTNEGAVGIPEDSQKVLDEMLRVVKPGGMVIFRESIWLKELEEDEKKELVQRYGTAPRTLEEWTNMFRMAGAMEILNEYEEWSKPRWFWDVRHDRRVDHYTDIFTISEKMMTAKKIMKKYGREATFNASENEKIFYQAVIAGKIGYAVIYGRKRS